jgi:phytoene/squalene synthetase
MGTPSVASHLTKCASKQTYYTIRFLVDRPRMEDAFRAYAYFRWVDDALDAELPSDPAGRAYARFERQCFLERQQSVLDECLRGERPQGTNDYEKMLVDLVHHAGPADVGLESYLRHMILVMAFDVRRRDQLISQAELDAYTGWLSVAVTEAMHHFIGNGTAPKDESRYLAVSGAHILHMLRDTYLDVRAGYFNVPRELLEANSIGPEDVQTGAYRAWVAGRVQLARMHFDGARGYFARVQNRRHRLAGLAYMARFEWLIGTLEREGYRVRPEYRNRRGFATGLRMSWLAIFSAMRLRGVASEFGLPRAGRP